MNPLITAAALRGVTGATFVDATYYLPNEGKDAKSLYAEAHIPGARFFDLDEVADHSSGLPHMLPAPAIFAKAVSALGIGNARRVVVYDQRGIFSAPRLWWMFRVFGHEAVQVLDGGLPAWVASGGAVENGEPSPAAPGDFTAAFRPEMVRALADMRRNLDTKEALVLDARAAGRFNGTVPEPRPGMKSGHIPGARSLPFSDLLKDGAYLPSAQLKDKFIAAGIDGSSPVVTSCGSGITAAVLTLGMKLAGLPEAAIYDGSWSEWGARDDTPAEV